MKFCLLLLFTLAAFSLTLGGKLAQSGVVAAVESINEDAQDETEEDLESSLGGDTDSSRPERSIFNHGLGLTQHLSRKVREAMDQFGSHVKQSHKYQKAFQL